MATGYIVLPSNAAVPDSSSPPGMRIEDGRVEWLFDADSDEIINWSFQMPSDYASGGILTGPFKMASATSGSVVWSARVMAQTPGDTADADTPSFDTAATDTEAVPGTAGYPDEFSIDLSSVMDSAAAGGTIQIELRRDADNGSDDATGDAELGHGCTLEYTTS